MDKVVEPKFKDHFEKIKARSFVLRTQPLKERRRKLNRLEKWILSNRGAIQQALKDDLQKPAQETDITEIYVVLSEIRLAKRNLGTWASRKYVGTSIPYIGSKAYVHHEPKGACLIISPWNYPFQLAISPLVSAITAGNTVIIKPSEYTSNTAELIQRMCEEIFDQVEVSALLGGVDESTELLKLPFDHIFFTGSPEVGKIVMTAAAKNLSSVTLELGGKSPTIVDQTANIKDAAAKIVWGKWQNSGQVCIAPDYLCVHEDVRDDLVRELAIQVEKIYGKKDNYGGMVSQKHQKRINELMTDAFDHGAMIEFGGTSSQEELTFNPTLLSNVGEGARILDEEIFGPILTLTTFRGLDEVIAYINKRPKPLALYLFTRSNKNIDLIKKNTSSGMMTINDTVLQFANPHLPIGGVNNSGIGKSHGHAGFLAFSNEKAILKQRVGLTVAKTVYPPYSKFKNIVINLLVKYF